MYNQRISNKKITSIIGSYILKRSIRSHKNILKELSEARPQWRVGELNREFRRRYGSTENALYHRKLLLGKNLITLTKGNYSLTSYAYSILSLPNLDKLVRERGFEELDLMILLELLEAKAKHRMFALRPSEISKKLGVGLASVYKSGSSLQKTGLIKSRLADELPKISQKMYRLTSDGKEVCRDVICSAIATRIIFDYKPPRWVSIAELMHRKWKYPRSVQVLIEKSFAYLTSRVLDASDLCKVTFNMFPWLEQITVDYVIQNYMKESVEQKEDSTGFKIDRKFIFTGSETVSNFVKQHGARVILFALESLHLDEAKPIIENSLLLGGMEGPMAYCIIGVGKSYNKAVYESETIYSKKLVKDVARQHGVRDSRMESIGGGHSKYLKVVDKEAYENVIFHVKSPFGAVMKTQFQDVLVLKRVPIVLGVFVSADDQVGISTGMELARMLRDSSKILAKPQIYADAVLNYVHKLPKIDRAFNQVHIVSKLEKCGVNTHAEFN